MTWSRTAEGSLTAVAKPSQALPPDARLEVAAALVEEFVSRGGTKLAGALDHCRLSVEGARVLDVGLSTGGFAECLLRRGAAFVLGVDVGRDQLHASLRSHPRLKSLEGVNARDLPEVLVHEAAGPEPFDLVVADVSFISLTLVLPSVLQYLKEGGRLLALVKPQFEVGREGLSKGGIVKSPAEHEKAKHKILEFLRVSSLAEEDYFASPIDGADGNKEFFVLARK